MKYSAHFSFPKFNHGYLTRQGQKQCHLENTFDTTFYYDFSDHLELQTLMFSSALGEGAVQSSQSALYLYISII